MLLIQDPGPLLMCRSCQLILRETPSAAYLQPLQTKFVLNMDFAIIGCAAEGVPPAALVTVDTSPGGNRRGGNCSLQVQWKMAMPVALLTVA